MAEPVPHKSLDAGSIPAAPTNDEVARALSAFDDALMVFDPRIDPHMRRANAMRAALAAAPPLKE